MSSEFERIQRYFWPLAAPAANPSPMIGNGDDALAVQASQPVVISVDTSVSGTHFPPDAAPEDVASKAVRSAISDLAAMGARQWFYTLSIVVPENYDETWWQRFTDQLHDENQHWQMPCLGGDTTSGAILVVTVQVHGLTEQPLRRSTAQVGDDIWVTGYLGDSAGGLAGLQQRAPIRAELLERFYRPEPPVSFMHEAAPLVHAAVDVSDGLVADLGHLVKASQCGARLDVNTLPLSPVLQEIVTHKQAIQWALAGGEDFAACFTAAPAHGEALQALAAAHGITLWRLGEITEHKGVQVCQDGEPYTLTTKGYDHFG
ncbi:MAG: thiamine-phosphate kinase [Natronospirillum sp.]